MPDCWDNAYLSHRLTGKRNFTKMRISKISTREELSGFATLQLIRTTRLAAASRDVTKDGIYQQRAYRLWKEMSRRMQYLHILQMRISAK